MNRFIFTAALSCLLILTAGKANAQKVGHLNFQNIIQAMSEYKTASDEYELYKQSLEDDLKMMETEGAAISKKYEAESKKPAPNQTRMQLYARQLEDLQLQYQQKQQSIQDSLTSKMSELIAPLKQRVEVAVSDVAKEKGYTHVIDNTYGTLVYADETYNLEEAVKAKLGIKDKPAANPGAGKPGIRQPAPGQPGGMQR